MAELTPQVEEIFAQRCATCHGPAGVRSYTEAKGGFDYVLDLDRLATARKLVKPGDAESSKLYTLVLSDEMPQGAQVFAEEPVPDAEKAIIAQWIEALGGQQLAAREDFISDADVLATIEADLATLPGDRAANARYLSLAHLYNAGDGDDLLEIYRQGVTKLVNSLTWQAEPVKPVALGPNNTVIRLDLAALGWSNGLWKDIASFNLNEHNLAAAGFNVFPDQDRARTYGKATAMGAFRFSDSAAERFDDPAFTYLKADWFAFVTSRPPLYHDILDLPNTMTGLEKRIGVDRKQNIADHKVMRAGVADSGVSLSNRMVERHDADYGAYWISYDFAENFGTQDLFSHPLGPYGDIFSAFRHDGGEAIFNLPNGFQAYMVATDENIRIDTAPVAIVQDSTHPYDSTVINGISCIACHADGMNAITDEIRAFVEATDTFSAADVAEVQALYPEDAVFQEAMAGDKQRFLDALVSAGIDPGLRDGQGVEPVASLVRRFERPIGHVLAAAEFGLTPEQFSTRMQASGDDDLKELDNRLQHVDMPRDQFAAAFVKVAENVVDDVDFPARPVLASKDPIAARFATAFIAAADKPATPLRSISPIAFTGAGQAPRPGDAPPVIGDKAIVAYISGEYRHAFELWQDRAVAGDPLAQFNLAVLHDRGQGTPQDAELAIAWYERAAEQGVVAALYQLGVIYSEGNAVPADPVRALYWFDQAAARGHVTALSKVRLIRGQADQVGGAPEVSLPAAFPIPSSG